MTFLGVLRSTRGRMALTWSVMVVAAAALLLLVINVALTRTLDDQSVTQQVITARQEGPFIIFDQAEMVVVDSVEREVNDRTLSNIRRVSMAAVVGLFPISLAVGWLVAGRGLRPVDRITRVARDIEATDLTRRIHLQGPDDELKRLADTFDAMLDRICEGVDDQRAFVQNASHELRTPLAVATTNLDVALRDPDPESVRNRAGIARRSLGRLGSLVDDLFFFARQQGTDVEVTDVDIDVLVAGLAEDFGEQARRRDIVLRTAASSGSVLELDRDGIHRAMANLLDNAVRLAPAGSVVTVGAGRLDGWTWLGVLDQGPGIPPEQQALVWQRFWRSSSGGTGLGLAIVRQTVESHQGKVSLTSELGAGSSFLLWLPGPDDHGPHPEIDPLWAAPRG
ncbi:MAG: HAMP domain-containing sensor histidine kinase [Actinomycetota bacterium]